MLCRCVVNEHVGPLVPQVPAGQHDTYHHRKCLYRPDIHAFRAPTFPATPVASTSATMPLALSCVISIPVRHCLMPNPPRGSLVLPVSSWCGASLTPAPRPFLTNFLMASRCSSPTAIIPRRHYRSLPRVCHPAAPPISRLLLGPSIYVRHSARSPCYGCCGGTMVRFSHRRCRLFFCLGNCSHGVTLTCSFTRGCLSPPRYSSDRLGFCSPGVPLFLHVLHPTSYYFFTQPTTLGVFEPQWPVALSATPWPLKLRRTSTLQLRLPTQRERPSLGAQRHFPALLDYDVPRRHAARQQQGFPHLVQLRPLMLLKRPSLGAQRHRVTAARTQ